MGSSLSNRIGSSPGRRSGGARRGRRPVVRSVEALEPRVVLATFTVTSAADVGAGTLRDAIEQANRSHEADVIEIAPAVSGPIVLSSQLPTLVGELEIKGPEGSRVTIARDGRPETPEFRIFTVARDAKVEIERLTITGGRADLGGGIRNDGELRLLFSDVVGNRANFKGGGVYNTGRFIVALGSIRDNVAEGVETLGFGPTTIGRGGGVYSSGVLVLSSVTVSGNRANREGGGIWNDDVMIVDNGTIAGNVAEGFALAPGKVPVGRGGGIFSTYLAQVNASTIVDNAANLRGGGFYSDVQRPRIEKGARIEDSYIQSTIVSGNTNGDLVVASGPFVSKGNNLVGEPSGVDPGPADLIGVAPRLAPLGDYGGQSETRPPMPGSPAIDAGRFDEDRRYDQRSELREPGKTDIGAVDALDFELYLIAGDAQSAAVGQPFPNPLIVSIGQAESHRFPVVGVPVAFTAPAEGPSAVFVGGPATIGGDDRAGIRAIANGIPGTYTVLANLPGAIEPVAFTLTNVGPDPAPEAAPALATASRETVREVRHAVGEVAGAIPRPSRFDSPRRAVAGALASASRAPGKVAATSSAWLARSADRLPSRLARWLGRSDQPTARNGSSSRPGTPISTSRTGPV